MNNTDLESSLDILSEAYRTNSNSIGNGASRSLTFDIDLPAYKMFSLDAFEASAYPPEMHMSDTDYHGWFAVAGQKAIIVQHEYTGDDNSNTVGVLDSNNQNMYTYIEQDAGSTVEFSFSLKNDPLQADHHGAVQVIWQGKVIDTITSLSDWEHKSYVLTASGGKDKLELEGVPTAPQTRNFIDNIIINDQSVSGHNHDHATDVVSVPMTVITPATNISDSDYHLPKSLDFEDAVNTPYTPLQHGEYDGWHSDSDNIGLITRFENYQSGNQIGYLFTGGLEQSQLHSANLYTMVSQAAGSTIDVSFDMHRDDSNETGAINVVWQGNVIDTVTSSEQWQHKEYHLVTSGGEDKLDFRAVTTAKSSGTFIDNVLVNHESSQQETHYHLPQSLNFEDAQSTFNNRYQHAETKYDGWYSDSDSLGLLTRFENNQSGNQTGDLYTGGLEHPEYHSANLYAMVSQAAGSTIDVSFDIHRDDSNQFMDASAINVVWQGHIIDTVTSPEQWQHKEYHLVTSGGEDKLDFRAVTTAKTSGTFIDNISVTAESNHGVVHDLSHPGNNSLTPMFDAHNISHAVIA